MLILLCSIVRLLDSEVNCHDYQHVSLRVSKSLNFGDEFVRFWPKIDFDHDLNSSSRCRLVSLMHNVSINKAWNASSGAQRNELH